MAGRRHLCAHTSGVGVNRPGAFAELISLPMTNIWHHDPGSTCDVAAIFDPFGNAVHTALQFPVLGEDVLITGAGPIGLHGGGGRPPRRGTARRRLRSQPLPARDGPQMGATLDRRPARSGSSQDVQQELGMTEGFDVGLEMSGQPRGAARR